MSRSASLTTAVLATLAALLFLGFLVGAFETFGGYLSRQRAFLWGSLAIGVAAALLLNVKWKVHFAVAGAFLFLSQVVYVSGQALGKTYYIGVTGAGDFVRALWAALNNQI